MSSAITLDEIKLLESAVVIKTTREYCLQEEAFATTDRDFIEFKPSILWQLTTLAWTLMLISIIFHYSITSRKIAFKIIGTAIGCLFFVGTLAAAFKQFTNKSNEFKIHIDREGIRIDTKLFRWANISETAILYKKRGQNSLLIAINDSPNYETFDLQKFKTFNLSPFALILSEYIEFFKPANSDRPPHLPHQRF